jgi:hypothetical protein
LEAQAVARSAPRKVARQAEQQAELSWRLRLAHLAVAPEQQEPLQAERCWLRVFLPAQPVQLR